MLALSFCIGFVVLASALTLKLIQFAQDGPYMDEIFHIPQAQQYCAYNFSAWDPMITTLPGLYLSSVLLLLPVANLQDVSLHDACTVQALRACNIIFCVGNITLLYLLSRKLNEHEQKSKRVQLCHVFNAVVLAVYPVLYFFTWLYYTDPGATFFTLLMYSLCLHKYFRSSALAGVVAVLFRQTNIIWVIFCVALTAIDVIDHQLSFEKKDKGNLSSMKDWDVLKLILQIFMSSSTRLFGLLKTIIITTFPYQLVLIGFVVFVVINHGIVVGDRTHHEASCNFPQVFYFLMVSAAFSFIHLIHPRQILSFLVAALKNPFKVLLFFVMAGLFIQSFTYEHKYLLSDNRHYTFYVWSKIFKRFHLARYLLIPVYMFSLYQFYTLTVHKGFLWRLTVTVCVIGCLIPQALLEFRYFVIPFYILRLNMKLPSSRTLLMELTYYAFINIFSVYMFVKKPFYWPDNPNLQRFMW